MNGHPDIRQYISRFVYQTYVATADANYLLARKAFLIEVNVDFFWLSVHALEKYFKAILLLNGQKTKNYKHDIAKLHEKVCGLDSSIDFGTFIKPSDFEEEWLNISVPNFIQTLYRRGQENNRYMLYGYSIDSRDLINIDQLVFSVRRYCRPFRIENQVMGKSFSIDNLKRLKDEPSFWRLDGQLLEKIEKAGSDDPRMEAFSTLNAAFFPDRPHDFRGWRRGAIVKPLEDALHLLKNGNLEAKRRAWDFIDWVRNYNYLSKCDKKELDERLSQYRRP